MMRTMQTALVTGAGGFLGRRLVTQLLALGARVRAVAAPHEEVPVRPGVDVVVADLARAGSLDGIFDGVDTAFHLAAVYQFGPADPAHMWRVNVEGAEQVFAGAAAAGALTVHVSSASALGRTGRELVDESYWAPQVAPIHYELTKREAHLRALLASARGARIRIAAPAAIYGPGDPSVTGQLMRLLAQRSLPAFGPSDVVQCPVHVEDCADALIRIATSGVDGELYCIGGEPIEMGAWIDLICDAAGRPHPRPVPARVISWLRPLLVTLGPLGGRSRRSVDEMLTVGCASYAYSSAKARRELGWQPRPLVEGLGSSVTS